MIANEMKRLSLRMFIAIFIFVRNKLEKRYKQSSNYYLIYINNNIMPYQKLPIFIYKRYLFLNRKIHVIAKVYTIILYTTENLIYVAQLLIFQHVS